MDEQRINPGYAASQLARALLTFEDETQTPDIRQRAADRLAAWTSVLDGMADGSLRIGSRTPVADLPVWVTPQVLRGGFATGKAMADAPWGDDETARAQALGLPQSRAALLASWLTDDGLAELTALLDAGTYRVDLPEDATLLVVAWLARAGATDAAWALLDTLAPLADRLRFTPRVAPAQPDRGDVVARRTAAQVSESLAQVRANQAVETQREVLSVWLPLTDDFLALWWDTRVDGALGRRWTDEHTQIARGLVARYDEALATSSCRKYRDPKENLPVLVAATRHVLDGSLNGSGELVWSWTDDGRLPVLQAANVVDAMVAKRGAPGSERLATLRHVQATVAQAPGRAHLAQVARDRLAGLPDDQGVDDVTTVLGPVTGIESDQARARADRFDVPAGAPMPPVVVRKVRLATAAPVEDLVAQGVVPSAEVLAELVPDLTAQQVGASYDDPALGRLMAQTYRAFRRRRSLLLLNLAHQIQFDELPWVAAVADRTAGRPDDPVAVGRRLAALAVDAFPATILPNPMISELSTLLGGLDLPLTEELAADIFMGAFSAKFPRAAREAATWLSGSLYERYYDLPLAEILEPDETEVPDLLVTVNTADKTTLRTQLHVGAVIAGRIVTARPFVSVDDLVQVRGIGQATLTRMRHDLDMSNRGRTVQRFADLCARDVPAGSRWSVARNGMVVERQQQLTTHNLAVLLGPGGVVPTRPWTDLAAEALATTVRLLVLAQSQDRPLATVKDAAYALRQALVFLSRTDAQSVTAVLDSTATRPGADRWPVTEVLAGICHVAAGGSFATDGTCPGGHRLVGWTVGPHWALSAQASR